MKKSILNSAITMAMAAALLSGSVLNTQAYAGKPAPAESIPEDLAAADNNSTEISDNYMLPGLGVGAATGAVVAGPMGLIIGGFVGAIIGANKDLSADDNEALAQNTATDINSSQQVTERTAASVDINSITEFKSTSDSVIASNKQVHLAQLGPMNNLVDDSIPSTYNSLLDAFTSDFSLDVYFRSGSTDIESFYPARLAAIADLIKSLDQLGGNKLELCLDGYADRRGDISKNIALASERIEKVRQQLVSAGIDENRINSKAFGEMKTVSAAGDLEAYTFDRKVVIRFEQTASDSITSMKAALADLERQETGHTANSESTDAVIADNGARF